LKFTAADAKMIQYDFVDIQARDLMEPLMNIVTKNLDLLPKDQKEDVL